MSVSLENLDAAFGRIMAGEAAHEEVKEFLSSTIPLMSEPRALAIGARALRARMVRVKAPANAIDVCGTGGDGAHTLNISTAVAFIAAGAGVPVAKHGNRAMSSKAGAADTLEALGVKLTSDVPTLERALAEANIAFLFAQNHHPAMRHVAAARKELGVRTIFNLLGPLSNPAGVKRQLVGVFAPEWAKPVAEALKELGAESAWVVHGAGGIDELAVAEDNLVAALDKGEVMEANLNFRDGDNPNQTPEALRGGTAEENAAALRALLEGKNENKAYRDAVLLNATAALVVADDATDLKSAWAMAQESLDSHAALAALNSLVAITKDAPENAS
ncbi:MAG: anthranilate phosphoribosyltransferase [Hyphomonadaceae bacterium]